MKVFYKVLDDRCIPQHGSQLAAGWDLKYFGEDQIELKPYTRALIPTGLFIAMDRHSFAKVEGRSGLAVRNGIIILGGVIDSDYRGEIKVIMYNADSRDSLTIKPYDRIAQLVFHKVDPMSVELTPIDSLPESERGSYGFGSTGVN